MFIKYLYSNGSEPIKINELLSTLKNLGKLLENETLPHNSSSARGINIKNSKNIKNRTVKKRMNLRKKTIKSNLNFKRNRKYRTRRLKKYLMIA